MLRWIIIGVILVLGLAYREQLLQITLIMTKVPITVFVTALALVVVEFILQAWRMKLVFKKSWQEILQTYAVGHFVAFSVPNRALGEVARVGAFSKLLKVPGEDALAYVGIERLLDVIILLMASLYLFSRINMLAAVIVGAGALAMLAALEIKRINDYFARLPWILGKYFKSARKIIKNRRILAYLLALTVILWLLDFLRVWIVVRAFGGNLDYLKVSALVAITYLVSIISFLPGGLVVWEGGLTTGLVVFGMDLEHALAATLFERLFSYWLWILVGALAAWRKVELHKPLDNDK